MSETTVLILYYSRTGKTAALADVIADGALSVPATDVRMRTVASLNARGEPETTAPETLTATPDDLVRCDALALGSPTRFGTMAAPLKHLWDQTTTQWLNGDLVDKPACVFTSTSTLHGGQEATLLSMMLPLLHHGMLLLGTPYTHPELHRTETGGTPYGPSHWDRGDNPLSRDEARLAFSQGQRLARTAGRLKGQTA